MQSTLNAMVVAGLGLPSTVTITIKVNLIHRLPQELLAGVGAVLHNKQKDNKKKSTSLSTGIHIS